MYGAPDGDSVAMPVHGHGPSGQLKLTQSVPDRLVFVYSNKKVSKD
jgi:hypothetical protein